MVNIANAIVICCFISLLLLLFSIVTYATDKSQASDSRNFVLANQVEDSDSAVNNGKLKFFFIFSPFLELPIQFQIHGIHNTIRLDAL